MNMVNIIEMIILSVFVLGTIITGIILMEYLDLISKYDDSAIPDNNLSKYVIVDILKNITYIGVFLTLMFVMQKCDKAYSMATIVLFTVMGIINIFQKFLKASEDAESRRVISSLCAVICLVLLLAAGCLTVSIIVTNSAITKYITAGIGIMFLMLFLSGNKILKCYVSWSGAFN